MKGLERNNNQRLPDHIKAVGAGWGGGAGCWWWGEASQSLLGMSLITESKVGSPDEKNVWEIKWLWSGTLKWELLSVPLGNSGVLAVASEGRAASEHVWGSQMAGWGWGSEERHRGRESWKTLALVCDLGDWVGVVEDHTGRCHSNGLWSSHGGTCPKISETGDRLPSL